MAISYSEYLDNERGYLREALSESLEESVTVTKSLDMYVSWVSLGPSLASGYLDFETNVRRDENRRGVLWEAATEFIEDRGAWKRRTPLRYLDGSPPIVTRISDRSPSMISQAISEVREVIELSEDNQSLDPSHLLGVFGWHDPNVPECKSAAVNIVRSGLRGELSSLVTSIPVPNWVEQEAEYRDSLVSELFP